MKWDLSDFSEQFKKQGWTAPIDWGCIQISDLQQMGLQKGHIVRFNRFLKEYQKDSYNGVGVGVDGLDKIKGIIYAIKSVSSDKYLDGRNQKFTNPLITARKPKGDKFLNWNIIKTNIGFALKSISSGYYLDGRGGQSNPLMTNRDPTNDKYLNWTFEKTNGGPSNIAIKSVSSGRYLDGRDPNHQDPLMTDRNPVNDKWLQWVIIPYL